MQRYLYLDIETIPAQRPDVLEEITSNRFDKLQADIAAIKPPGNYKKEDTIVAWWNDEAPKIIDSMKAAHAGECEAEYRKTGLDGAFGQVCVIGYAVDDHEPVTLCESDWQRNTAEQLLLRLFRGALQDEIHRSEELSTTVIGHNVIGFDLRYLMQRSFVNEFAPHSIIARAAQAKPWETDRVYDTMVQWAGVGRTISLDRLCKALSVPTSKGEITGATVWDFVKAGQIEAVAAYCADDVRATREVHKLLTFSAKFYGQ